MPPTPARLAESVVSQLTSAAARHAETWVRQFGMKCERTAPGQTPPAYHASWKSGGAAGAAPVLIAALADAAGVKGTPFESAADSVSKLNAPDWLPYAAKVYRILLDRP